MPAVMSRARPRTQLPVPQPDHALSDLAREWDDPNGVLVSAVLVGARGPTTIPQVTETRDCWHGVFLPLHPLYRHRHRHWCGRSRPDGQAEHPRLPRRRPPRPLADHPHRRHDAAGGAADRRSSG
ncbi:MAG: phosphoenolpyruvate carboxykinase (GTP) [Actinophytocola sp.]|nr:phosphoenolpyruvate carboxykinase (GTP) [Actinophytocola sp.]